MRWITRSQVTAAAQSGSKHQNVTRLLRNFTVRDTELSSLENISTRYSSWILAASCYSSCSLSVQSFIVTQLFSILWSWTGCWPFFVMFCILVLKLSFSQNLFFHSHLSLPQPDLLELWPLRALVVIFAMLQCLINRHIIIIIITRCLAVTGGASIGKCGRLSHPSSLLVHTIFKTVVLTQYSFICFILVIKWLIVWTCVSWLTESPLHPCIF